MRGKVNRQKGIASMCVPIYSYLANLFRSFSVNLGLCCCKKSLSITDRDRFASINASLSRIVTRRFKMTSFMMLMVGVG